MAPDKFFHRGKEARSLGKPRELYDARHSLASREAFFRGWDEQDRFMRPPSVDQIAEANQVREKLRAFAKTL